MLKIIARGTAIRGRDGTSRQSCEFPGICVLPGGRWLCSCRAAPTTGQHPILARSDDEGKTWSDPSLPFFNDKTEGLFDTRIFSHTSEDDGETWFAPELIDTTPFNVPTPVTGPVLVLSENRWACQFELNKHYDDASQWEHSSVMMFSGNHGRSTGAPGRRQVNL